MSFPTNTNLQDTDPPKTTIEVEINQNEQSSGFNSTFEESACNSEITSHTASLILDPFIISPSVATNNISLGGSIRQPSPLYHENEFRYYKAKRCSSLKTPRATSNPAATKAVRFADAFGLDLATVKTVFDNESPPKIPASARNDLCLSSTDSLDIIGTKCYQICFAQPNMSPLFLNRVLVQSVSLESAEINTPIDTLTGLIRVKNISFEKHVLVRITYNKWQSHTEVAADYVTGSEDNNTDKFRFNVSLPALLGIGDDIQFAIRYEVESGEQFWDSNFGQNYRVLCCMKEPGKWSGFGWGQYL